jgi:hypothetical protein
MEMENPDNLSDKYKFLILANAGFNYGSPDLWSYVL